MLGICRYWQHRIGPVQRRTCFESSENYVKSTSSYLYDPAGLGQFEMETFVSTADAWPRSKMTSIRRVPAATPNGPPKPILSAASWYENSPAHSAWAVAIDEQRPRQSVLEPV
jgi:hypothetical protein